MITDYKNDQNTLELDLLNKISENVHRLKYS